MKKSVELYRQGKLNETIALLEKETSKHPKNYEAFYVLGRCYLKKGDTTNAINAFLAAARKTPPELKYVTALGEAYLHRGLFASASQQFDFAVMKDPKDLVARNNLAFCYMRMRKYDKAIENYETTIKLDPNNEVALANLGEIYAKHENDREKALEYYQRFLALAPDSNLAPTIKSYIETGKFLEEIAREKKEQKLEKDTEIAKELAIEYGKPKTSLPLEKSIVVLVQPIYSDKYKTSEQQALADYVEAEIFNKLPWKPVREVDFRHELEMIKRDYSYPCQAIICFAALAEKVDAAKVISTKIASVGSYTIITLEIYNKEMDAIELVLNEKLKLEEYALFEALDSLVSQVAERYLN